MIVVLAVVMIGMLEQHSKAVVMNVVLAVVLVVVIVVVRIVVLVVVLNVVLALHSKG